MRHSVTIWAEGDEVFILIPSTVFDEFDVVHVDVDLPTRVNGAPVSGFAKNAPSYLSGYMGPRTAQVLPPFYGKG